MRLSGHVYRKDDTTESRPSQITVFPFRHPESIGSKGNRPAPLQALIASGGSFELIAKREHWVVDRLYRAEVRTLDGDLLFSGTMLLSDQIVIGLSVPLRLRLRLRGGSDGLRDATAYAMPSHDSPILKPLGGMSILDGLDLDCTTACLPEDAQELLFRFRTKDGTTYTTLRIRDLDGNEMHQIEVPRELLTLEVKNTDGRNMSAVVAHYVMFGRTATETQYAEQSGLGQYHIPVSPAGDNEICINKSGYVSRVVRIPSAKCHSQHRAVTLKLAEQGPQVVGRAETAEGEAVEGAVAICMPPVSNQAAGFDGAVVAKSNQNGRFILPRLGLTRTRLLLSHPQFPFAHVSVGANLRRHFRFVIPKTSTVWLSVRGKGTVVGHTPVLHWHVCSRETRVQRRGVFVGPAQQMHLPVGSYSAFAFDRKGTVFGQRSFRVCEGKESWVDVDLTKCVRITRRVLTTKREPVAGAAVSLVAACWPESLRERITGTISDASGRFSVLVPQVAGIKVAVRVGSVVHDCDLDVRAKAADILIALPKEG